MFNEKVGIVRAGKAFASKGRNNRDCDLRRLIEDEVGVTHSLQLPWLAPE
jgi:hypothetical protein